jgi:hypothetical protein
MPRRLFGISRLLPVAVALLCAACAEKPPVHAEEQPQSAPTAATPKLLFPVAPNREADDLARFLAGLPAREGSSFEELHKTPEWEAHAQQSDRMWEAFETKRVPALRDFSQEELDRFHTSDPTVFYPFGGPDSLMATLFFPKHSNYILVGLEPPGSLIPAKRFKPEELAEKLGQIRGTLDSLLARSFFITRQMDKELRGQIADGLLLPIMVQLVRQGDTIRGLQYAAVDADAKLALKPDPWDAKTKNRGVLLEFEDSDHALHQLAYFSVNLDDDHLAKNPQFFQWLNAAGPSVTFFKSTSYMIHQKPFSRIREQVLEHSVAVLQDDSGIPYHFFTEKDWNVQLYGEFDKPYGSFRYLVQPDLKKAYQEGANVKKLNFRIGYGFGKVPSNLQLATPR